MKPFARAAAVAAAIVLAAGVLCADSAFAVTVRGFVKRTTGTPVANVDLDVFDAATGVFVFIVNDRTGADGFYSIVLNPGTYNITYTPPPALRLAGYRLAGVVVSGGAGAILTLPDALLEPGFQVSGHVDDNALPPNPAPNVEVRFFDAVTGLSVFAAANVTGATGNFSVLVPARTYNLIYAPAAGDTLLPLKAPGVVVSADLSMAAVALSRGHTIQGLVRDPGSIPVPGADVDVFDAFTGDQILTVHDDTDPNGHFSFVVPAGTFDIDFFPPAGLLLAALKVESVVVAGPLTLAPVTLPAGVTLSGRVVDGGGLPVADVDLDFVNLDTDDVYPTVRDNTGALGNFAVNVPPGLYDVRFDAPLGSGLAAAVVRQVSIQVSLSLADVVFPPGRSVTGRMIDEGAPGGPAFAPGVTFVAFDDISGTGFPVVGNPSALDGTFALVLPPGRWVLEPLPPRGSLMLAEKQPVVDLTGLDVALGDVFLQRGVTLTGRVIGPSGAVRHVDLDVIDMLGTRLITPRDDTDPVGMYSVVVPDGATYTVEYEPPRSTDLAAAAVPGVAVAGPTARPDVSLPRGVIVTGRVISSPPAAPIFNVDLNVKTALGVHYLTPHDNTLSDGTFKVVLPPGGDALATIDFSPPRGSRHLPATLASLDLSADTDLGDVVLNPGFLVSGRVTRPDGTGVRDVDLTVFDTTTGFSIRTPHDNTDGVGDYVVTVPAGTYNINYIPPPPQLLGERLIPGRLTLVVVAGDVPALNVALQTGVWVRGRVVQDILTAVAAADLDFIRPDGATEFTPQDKTDTSGFFNLVVPPNTYTLTVEPPAGTRLIGARRSGVVLTTDNLAVPLFRLYSGYLLSGLVLDDSSQAVVGADIDVVDPATGLALFTPGDNTDQTGLFRVTVPPGVWDLRFDAPANSNLASVRRDGTLVGADTVLSDTILPAGFRVEGKIFDAGTTPLLGAEAVFIKNGKEWPAQGNVADISGRFRTLLPSGTYDIVFTPPSGSGLAPQTLSGIVVTNDVVLADAHLLPAQASTLGAVAPPSGSARGGGPATLTGSGFVTGARVFLGGVEASITSLSAGSISVILPPHPPGAVDVTVINPGASPDILPGGFTYTRRNPDISVTMSRSGEDLILSWAPTGQTTYKVFRSGTAAGILTPVVVATTGSTSQTITGGAHPAAEEVQYYDVE